MGTRNPFSETGSFASQLDSWTVGEGGSGGIGGNLTLQVLVQDVLEAVEDRLVIFDLSALGGVRPLLAALEVGVHLTRVGGVLLVMCHLHTEEAGGGGGTH